MRDLDALVADYISRHYPPALAPFLAASGLPNPTPQNPDLATLVADGRSAHLAQQLERTHIEPSKGPGSIISRPLDAGDALTAVQRSLDHVTNANLTAVVVGDLPRRHFNTATAEYETSWVRSVVCAGADKDVRVLDWESGEVAQILTPHKAPVLSLALHPTNPRYVLSGAMDGTAVLSDVVTHSTLQTLSAGKFVVRVAFSPTGRWLATASYDKSVSLYEATTSAHAERTGDDDADLWLDALDASDHADAAGEPALRYELRHKLTTSGNPEALLFDSDSKWLMYTQRGSHCLHYLSLPAADSSEWTWEEKEKSFNPHPLDTHVSFAVLDLALHPSGRIVAAITGDHAGPGAERVLLYTVEPEETERLGCLWTRSEPDAFVLPRLQFLPSGNGIVTSNANGELTLLSLQGDVRSKIKVHAARDGVSGTSDVVRDFAVVELKNEEQGLGEEEKGWEVVSVGYDRTVKFTVGRQPGLIKAAGIVAQ